MSWLKGAPPKDGELYLIAFLGKSTPKRCYCTTRWVESEKYWSLGSTMSNLTVVMPEERITHWRGFEGVVELPRRRRAVVHDD